MLKTRVMPCLLLKSKALVKTIKFRKPCYIGDPANTIRIFNTKEVDELILLDIMATPENKRPQFDVIAEIASECLMPVTYGGGIRSIKDIETIFGLGIEKVAINSYAVENPDFIEKAAKQFGSQSIVVSIDVKKNIIGKYRLFTRGGKESTGIDPVSFACQMERTGAGEILLNSIDRDGTMDGYDLEVIKYVSDAINLPLIACGGAGKVEDFAYAVNAGASAVAAGSIVVYQGTNRAVLINFPTEDELKEVLGTRQS